MPNQDRILLKTKLHQPRLPQDLVTRTRLIERLNTDIDCSLILVCAPAGFGKTTLVSNWLRLMTADPKMASARLPAAWLSLDENDGDLNLFLHYFIAALRTIFTEACEATLALLKAPQSPPLEVLYATFINELEDLPGEAILVLDDYHTIHGVEVHRLLGELVRQRPRPLRLVLISRINPPVQLSNLRARGKVAEIRTRDLRFTPEEMAAYLSKTQFALMGQRVLPLLVEHFEGWPAGLRLAALSMRSAGSQEVVLRALSSDNPDITNYLVDEVLNQQHPPIRSFLLQISILNRFCLPLSEALIGEGDPTWNASACLEWIEHAELFLIPLDDQREWYRYHHVFQQLLRKKLSAEKTPDEISNLHHRASAWFENHGLIDEALQHALAANDLDLAARLMEQELCEVINREDRLTLERWLRLLPGEMIEQRPGLLMIKAWALQYSWQIGAQLVIVQQVENLLETERGAALSASEWQILRAQIALIRAQEAYFSNQPERAIVLCQEVLALAPSNWTFLHGIAMLYKGMALQASGQASAAEHLLLDEYEALVNKTDIYALSVLGCIGKV